MNGFNYDWNSLPSFGSLGADATGMVQNLALNLQMDSPLPSLNSIYESDLLRSNLSDLGSALQQLKNKPVSQHVVLMVWHIVFDMMDNNIDFDEDSLSEQVLKTLNSQMVDAIQRARWTK